jgi:hypothetical protein
MTMTPNADSGRVIRKTRRRCRLCGGTGQDALGDLPCPGCGGYGYLPNPVRPARTP